MGIYTNRFKHMKNGKQRLIKQVCKSGHLNLLRLIISKSNKSLKLKQDLLETSILGGNLNTSRYLMTCNLNTEKTNSW